MSFRLVGTAFTLATFPGLVTSAAIQDSVAGRAGVPTVVRGDGPDAYEADYGALGSPPAAAIVAVLPSILCSMLAVALFAVAVRFVPFWTLRWWMCTWFGLAVAAHAFPDPDAAAAFGRAVSTVEGPAAAPASLVVSVLRVTAALSLIRVDVLYAALLYYAVAAALLPGAPALALPTLPVV